MEPTRPDAGRAVATSAPTPPWAAPTPHGPAQTPRGPAQTPRGPAQTHVGGPNFPSMAGEIRPSQVVGREIRPSQGRGEEKLGPVDQQVAELAARQHGVVALDQLGALGLQPGGVAHRLLAGRLHRLHAGVYAVGHMRLTQRGRWMAAVLACGDGALLSHRSASELWGIGSHGEIRIDVTVPDRSGRRRPKIAIHRPRTLPDKDRVTLDGIPVTTPPEPCWTWPAWWARVVWRRLFTMPIVAVCSIRRCSRSCARSARDDGACGTCVRWWRRTARPPRPGRHSSIGSCSFAAGRDCRSRPSTSPRADTRSTPCGRHNGWWSSSMDTRFITIGTASRETVSGMRPYNSRAIASCG